MLEFAIRQRSGGRISQAEFASVGDDAVIGSAVWSGEDGVPRESYQVLTIRDGKIGDMQDCRSRRQAERFARN